MGNLVVTCVGAAESVDELGKEGHGEGRVGHGGGGHEEQE